MTIDLATLRLATIVESSDDAIITQALDGTIETWNGAAERMFGYPAAAAIGLDVDRLTPPVNAVEQAAVIERVLNGESVTHFETTGLTAAGTTIPISLTISPLRTPEGQIVGLSRIARDISHQKALEASALRLAAIVDSAEDAIVSKDLNGIIQTWNRGAEKMFGFTAAEAVGRSILLIIPPERQDEEHTVLSHIRAGRKVEHFETVRRRKDGTLIDISLSVSPLVTAAGQIIGASKIARDITSQRRLMRQAEEANRVKDEFLAMLSHELRTPLNAVLGYARMLRTGHVSEARQEHAIDVIERNASLLSQIVSDVLDVSSIVTGKMRLKPQPCDLVPLVAAAVDSLRPAAEAKGVALTLHGREAALPLMADPDRLQQVFWNLLSNAVKFTPGGGRVEVDVRRRDGVAEVVVADSGLGIPPETLPHVFQRFWQGENAAGGLGLGLALSHHFVELHGGTIAAESEGEGRGATFTVRVPWRAPAD